MMTVRPKWVAPLAVAAGAALGLAGPWLVGGDPPGWPDLAVGSGLILYFVWFLHRDGVRATADGSSECGRCDAGFDHAEPDAPHCCKPPFDPGRVEL